MASNMARNKNLWIPMVVVLGSHAQTPMAIPLRQHPVDRAELVSSVLRKACMAWWSNATMLVLSEGGREAMKKGKAKPRKERVPRCPECKSEDVAVLCFGDEPTQMVCNNCEHEWKPRGG